MSKFCYYHQEKKARNECDRCQKPICTDCSKTYWKTNAIAAMFNPQKEENVKLIFCPRCLKIEKIKNTTMTFFFLILVLGVIATGIFFL
ncbi:MAG: hypothetical protein ACTSQE_08120 [Candidatus Heimdallarchaeaceae archaeon]